MQRRHVVIGALALGILVDAFFALVNFYPVAPRPSRGRPRYVIAAFDASQGAWFQANVLDPFGEERNVDLELLRVDDPEQILPALSAARAQGKDVILVELPAALTGPAQQRGLFRPFTEVASEEEIREDFADVDPRVVAAADVGGHPYFLPRMALLDVAVYRLSKVRDAARNWVLVRPQIEAALRERNGWGLPAGYQLDLAPARWDSYDVFVLGYYWAHRRYHGEHARPRIAHRTGDSIDGQQDIIAGVYHAGATDADIGNTDSRAARDYFAWETLDREAGIYDPAMYSGRYGDDDVIDGLRSGALYLATVDEMEAFALHGGAHRGATAQVDDPSDLAFTEVPDGASLALNDDGRPLRRHPSFSFREDWVWALPAGGSAGSLAYDFVKFSGSSAVHAAECEALGMIPLRKDVVADRASLFRLAWMTDVFAAAFDQLPESQPAPRQMLDAGLGSTYAQLWQSLVAERGYARGPSPDRAIEAALRAPPKPRPLHEEAAPPLAASATQATSSSQPASAPAAVIDDDDWRGAVPLEGLPPASAPVATPAPRPAKRRWW